MNTPRGIILRPSEISAIERGGGAQTIPLVNSSIGSTSFLSGITSLAPGASIPLHFHNCDESVFLLEGQAIAEIDGTQHDVRAGEMSFIPTGIPHRFINTSATASMRILWTYASPDADRTIVETGEIRRIDDEHRAAFAVPPPG